MKHTQGKWQYHEERAQGSPFHGMFVIHNEEEDFAYVEDYSDPYNHEKKEANAKLIAAAPELLEACKSALWGMEVLSKAQPDHQGLKNDIDKLKQAIKKATS